MARSAEKTDKRKDVNNDSAVLPLADRCRLGGGGPFCYFSVSIKQTAWAAIPSFSPEKPSPSSVVALTLT